MAKISRLFGIIAITCGIPVGAFGHPGGLDSSGGHSNRKSGGYHYHRGGGGASNPEPTTHISKPPLGSEFQPIESVPPKPAYRTTPRIVARTSARTESMASTTIDTSAVESFAAAFLFHMKSGDPRPVLDFKDNDKYWRASRPANSDVNFPKDLVIRIEPTKDLTERRTWIDSTGHFSTVARFVKLDANAVVLSRIDGHEFRIVVGRLSDVDRSHIDKIVASDSRRST